MTTRVLVADDEALVRGSFRLLVDSAPGLSAVGEAATGEEAVAISRRERPDVVLMDVRMPVMNGIEATRHICAAHPEVRVLIVTTFDLDEYVYGALRAGAAGFLLKDTPPPDLLKAIQVIAGGDALLAPTVTQRLIERYVAHVPPPKKLEITEREREVLVLIARGLSNHEIGAALHLSLGTVKTHVGRLLTKLDARTRVHLVIVAYEAGLVP
ncbi:response regulator transcription factor [Nonomuraea turkmeniaca]|uniref:Response regulator transcription factor n=1 Tax=Nonomuraea turkmeniaca TaxID=103838 RepID=A0A5S4FY54_9ACTN|nr:response regulator transcription factor [Nonomuraea turkmeniaca]TMR25628.1 response regulator transcription factor [Nonomuraea turkmeniaca]